MNRFLSYPKSLIAIIVSVTLTLAFLPCSAFASNSNNLARSCFSNTELSRLFEKCSLSECEFVMHDYDSNTDSYLKVRNEYRSTYDELIGDDSVSLFSGSGIQPDVVFDDRPLLRIDDPSDEPWCDLLYLTQYNIVAEEKLSFSYGSAFMISENIAVTAAHCVYDAGKFYDGFLAQSCYDNMNATYGIAQPSKIIVTRDWIDSAGTEATSNNNFDQDFAILVFDEAPSGTSGIGLFSYESISVAQSLLLAINCAGYLVNYEGDGKVYAYKNMREGSISLIDYPPLDNTFHMDLSAEHGMSGGPVYYTDNGSYTAVGIISYEHVSQTDHDDGGLFDWNFACRITERLQTLIAWAEESGFNNITPSSSGGSGSGSGSASPNTGGSIADMYKHHLEE